MSEYEDRELEETLRSFPTTAPSEALRERVLAAAEPSPARRAGWKQGLAYALILLGLLALDVAIDRAQSARLSRLIGDGSGAMAMGQDSVVLALIRERDAAMVALLEREGRMP